MQVNVEKGGGREEIISGTSNYYRNSPPNPLGKSHFYRSVCQIAFSDLSTIILKIQIWIVNNFMLDDMAVLNKS